MAEGTGFEPVIMESKSNALDQTKLTPSKIIVGAANRVRTGDIHVGNVMLYQLSYSRIVCLVVMSRVELPLDSV